MASILQIGGKWRALVRRKGHKSQCKTFRTKAQAEIWARGLESQIDLGSAPLSPSAVSVKRLIEEYRHMREAARPVADTSTEHYILARLEDDLGPRSISSLTPADLVDYAQRRKVSGAGPYTVNMEISKLGTVIKYAGAALRLRPHDIIGESRPLLSHLGLIGGGGKRTRRPTQDEIEAVIAHLDAHHKPIYGEAVRFAIASAMRRGEICRIAWEDLDATKRLVLVRDRKDPRQKVGNDQWVPLLPLAWEIVQRQPTKLIGGRIFPMHHQTTSKYFTEACRALGIPDLHFHDLRHDGTSRMFEDGMQIQHVALVTGHKDWRNLRRYTNLKPEDVSMSAGVVDGGANTPRTQVSRGKP